jgi:hypothetical protein
MTLLVRDEEDIIRQNVLYHLRMGVDFVIATDNKSVDGTIDILSEFESLGVLYLIREEQDNYAQGVWVSRMAHLAKARFNADWVINCDADEFWWPISGNLSETLRRVPNDYDVVSAPRYNFVPRSVKGTTPWYESMVFREKSSTNTRGRPLPPKVCHRGIENIKVIQGNHHISWPKRLAVFPQTPIEILHFPLRSYAQFENKIVKGGSAYERNTDLRANIGRDWRRLYKQWKRGKLHKYYQKQIWPDIRLQRGIDNGLLVLDTRLKDFFQTNAIALPA